MSDLVDARLAICRDCPLYKVGNFGPVCDSKKYINREGDVRWLPKDGYTRGCGCLLKQKAANAANHCIIKKW